MKVSKLDLPDGALEHLDSEGFKVLYPPQQQAVKAGMLDGKSILVSAPTASGKTLIAMLAILSYLSRNSGKAVYLSPLKALASEKYSEFKKMENIAKPQIKVAISTGDFEELEKNLQQYNVLILTNEKMDSIMRHNAAWIDKVGLVIADEIHLIGDQDRGPTLEMVLSRLGQLEPVPQIVGLSATVTNSDEVAQWLDCIPVKSEWRPVPLSEWVCDGGEVIVPGGENFEIETSARGLPVDLCLHSVRDGGQALLFAETRARSMSQATRASDAVSKLLSDDDVTMLKGTAKKILANNEHTKVVLRLADLVERGVAFHHAGMNQDCRNAVESGFRNGNIKMVSSTPTLAAGVNLPARRVVISSISRYDFKKNENLPISVLEYKQLSGRAGRPQYDDHGESIVVAGGLDPHNVIEHYVFGEPEPILSKITGDKSLRIHVLSMIVTNPAIKDGDIVDFFLKTLGGCQSTKSSLTLAVRIALRLLVKEGMLKKKGDRYAATGIGKKTSQLYLDPMTAAGFVKSLEMISEKKSHTFGILHMISNCDEFFPKFSLRNKDYEDACTLIEANSQQLIEPISEYDCNRSLLALYSWIHEATEVCLSDNLGVESGDMYRMAETGNWLLYCLRVISKEIGRADLLAKIDILRTRIKYGIKPELVDLVGIRGIGRTRARILYRNKITDIDALRGIRADKLARIDKIGTALANNIKTQLRRVG